jgi:hypothetical protein
MPPAHHPDRSWKRATLNPAAANRRGAGARVVGDDDGDGQCPQHDARLDAGEGPTPAVGVARPLDGVELGQRAEVPTVGEHPEAGLERDRGLDVGEGVAAQGDEGLLGSRVGADELGEQGADRLVAGAERSRGHVERADQLDQGAPVDLAVRQPRPGSPGPADRSPPGSGLGPHRSGCGRARRWRARRRPPRRWRRCPPPPAHRAPGAGRSAVRRPSAPHGAGRRCGPGRRRRCGRDRRCAARRPWARGQGRRATRRTRASRSGLRRPAPPRPAGSPRPAPGGTTRRGRGGRRRPGGPRRGTEGGTPCAPWPRSGRT